MPAVSQSIPGLIGGVSQQPDTLKLPNQLRTCDNYYPDPTFGLAKRPGVQALGKLTGAVENGYWFTIFRDKREKYIGQFGRDGLLKIWDANTGLSKTINTVTTTATNYAKHTEPGELEVFQINDYTFVLNKTVTAKEDTTLKTPTITPFGFITINTVTYASKYTVTLDSVDYVYTSPTTSTTQLNIKDISDSLVSSINAGGTFVATAIGNVIHVRRANNLDFSLQAKGGQTGSALEAYKGVVPTVSQLPKQFINNSKIRVESAPDSPSDDYWVEFETTDGGSFGAGSWIERPGPNVIRGFDATTMPHAIIREADGTFTYRMLDYASALASPGSVVVTGVPTSVGINQAVGRYVVGETFTCTGGAGADLRLRVDSLRSENIVTNYNYPTPLTSYVERRTIRVWNLLTGRWTTTIVYAWIIDGVEIATSNTDANVNQLGATYTRTSTYTTISTTLARAAFSVTSVRNDLINTVSITQAGQGYLANDIVSNTKGDTFKINTVGTVSRPGDSLGFFYWGEREAGDEKSNPAPTFVNRQITGISFYKNRLVFLSGENAICSQASEVFNFYASSVITILDNDPVDISCGSIRPINLNQALQVSRGLLLFSEDAQYILETTTEAFSPSTAEINLIGGYSLNDRIAPVNTGSSIIFQDEGDKASNIFEMAVGEGVGANSQVLELTRLVPSYIPAEVRWMKASSTMSTVVIATKQEKDSLYVFRFFNNGNQRAMASWFRWKFIGDVLYAEFDHDTLYLVLRKADQYVITKASLLTETSGGAVQFEGEWLDLRLDCFDYVPTVVYNSAPHKTRICFKDGFGQFSDKAILTYLSDESAGLYQELPIQFDNTAPVGQKYYLEIDGDHSEDKFAIGYRYVAEAQLPAFFVQLGEGVKDTLNIPQVHRLKINSYNSGPYQVKVESKGRDPFQLTLPQIFANQYQANDLPIVRNAQSTVPILAKGTEADVTLIAEGIFPTAFTSIVWEGRYDNKGIRQT